MNNHKVLVCGGRDYEDRGSLRTVLDAVHMSKPITLLIAGGARGADTMAEHWARDNGVARRIVMADWDKHGNAAGPIRNQQMLDDCKPDMVIAFPGGRGTRDMIQRAEKAGVVVVKITE